MSMSMSMERYPHVMILMRTTNLHRYVSLRQKTPDLFADTVVEMLEGEGEKERERKSVRDRDQDSDTDR